MSQKEIELLFNQLDASVQLLRKELDISYLEALSETGENILVNKIPNQIDGFPSDEIVGKLTQLYKEVSIENMESEDIRKAIQLALLKASKTDALQPNHQMTPDAIGFILNYLIEKLISGKLEGIRLLDPAVGMGNLLSTVYNGLVSKNIMVEAEGIDNDDLLLTLASVSTTMQRQNVTLTHQDALQDLLMDPVDVVVSDLPVGYYPLDEKVSKYKTAAKEGHSYAHHLFIEQSLHYLKDGGFGIFLVPAQLFETDETPGLMKMIQEESFLQGMLNLPNELFKTKNSRKSILLIQKKGNNAKQAKQVLLAQIPDFKNQKAMLQFMQEVDSWKTQNS
ncbi:class I SAM-dependent methyltransferase [Carnobacterium jeotgali]|uniref:class I SAM-dependent methyltransferase n=1 Tax=Carnobacterium jeotgali TaxID=545534 RepID=UPI00388D8395